MRVSMRILSVLGILALSVVASVPARASAPKPADLERRVLQDQLEHTRTLLVATLHQLKSNYPELEKRIEDVEPLLIGGLGPDECIRLVKIVETSAGTDDRTVLVCVLEYLEQLQADGYEPGASPRNEESPLRTGTA